MGYLFKCLSVIGILSFFSCAANGVYNKNKIAVFIPGQLDGSPIYQMLADGVIEAATMRDGVSATIIEAGTNQSEWETKLTALAASANYGLIISSNPSMPAICQIVSQKFPEQRFILLDGTLEGNDAIYTFHYNQKEQAWLAGYMAGLLTSSSLPGITGKKHIALIAGQEYPAMNSILLPSYTAGAQAVDPAIHVEFRVVGSWIDAGRGADLSSALARDGVDVFLPIAGGANQGVLQAAAEYNRKVIWFDINGYAKREGTVLGSAILHQDRAARELTLRYLDDMIPFGSSETAGMKEGYVDFVLDDPLFIQHVPQELRTQMSEVVEAVASGRITP